MRESRVRRKKRWTFFPIIFTMNISSFTIKKRFRLDTDFRLVTSTCTSETTIPEELRDCCGSVTEELRKSCGRVAGELRKGPAIWVAGASDPDSRALPQLLRNSSATIVSLEIPGFRRLTRDSQVSVVSLEIPRFPSARSRFLESSSYSRFPYSRFFS